MSQQSASVLSSSRAIKMIAVAGVAMLSACAMPSDAELVARFENGRTSYEAVRDFIAKEHRECQEHAGEYNGLEIEMRSLRSPFGSISYDWRVDPICSDTVNNEDLRRLAAISADLRHNWFRIEQRSAEWFSFLWRKDTPDGPAYYFEYAPRRIETNFDSVDEIFESSKKSPSVDGYRALSDNWYIHVISF